MACRALTMAGRLTGPFAPRARTGYHGSVPLRRRPASIATPALNWRQPCASAWNPRRPRYGAAKIIVESPMISGALPTCGPVAADRRPSSHALALLDVTPPRTIGARTHARNRQRISGVLRVGLDDLSV